MFAIIGLWPWAFGGRARIWSVGIGAAFLVVALLWPAVLAPLNRVWTRFGLLLHQIVSPVVLGVMEFAFLGGSLIAHGGQNPLEPARLGIAVLTGPHTHNFDETFRVLLDAQGMGMVRTSDELSTLAVKLINDPDLARRWGERARTAAAGMEGALKASVDVAEALLACHASA